jgi:hypothetical protein
MTRKTALKISIETLKSLGNTEFTEVIHRLQELYAEMPLSRWTERSIYDAIAQWVAENDKQPSVFDLDHSYMPSHTTIRHVLGINAKDYIQNYFPSTCRTDRSPYGKHSVDDLLDLFKQEYNKMQAPSSVDFNKYRSKGTPCWQTYAEMIKNGATWLELVAYCNLEPHKKKSTIPKRYRMNECLVRTISTNYEKGI